MDDMDNIEQRMAALEAKVHQMVRVCKVTRINPDAGTVRVSLPDAGNMESFDLPVLFKKTQDDHYYTMPDIGEQVVCVFLPIGLEQGFVLGAVYSGPDPVPHPGPDITRVEFANGAYMEHDRATGGLDIFINGDIDITAAGHMTLVASRIDLNP
jgi:phage baseplate assembly protein V